MRNKLYSILLILCVWDVSFAQDVDSFFILPPYADECETYQLISMSTNYTSLQWQINKGYQLISKTSNDSIWIIRPYELDCYDINLIIGRGNQYDTIHKYCGLRVPPISITVWGNVTDTVEVFSGPYTDSGYYYNPKCDSLISMTTIGFVNTNVVGKYEIKYTVINKYMNDSSSISRIVYVVDRTDPTLSMKGWADYKIERFCHFDDPGIHFMDNYWSIDSIKVFISSFDSSIIGINKITYTVIDGSGNSASCDRIVEVIDPQPPNLTDTTVTIEVYHTFAPEFWLKHYCCDSSEIQVFSESNVDTSKIGFYYYKTWLIDCHGNLSDTAIHTVCVVDKTPPVIHWIPKQFVYFVYRWDTLKFNPLDSVFVSDNYDTNLTIELSGNYYSSFLKYHQLGIYSIQFNAEDKSGNKAIQFAIYIDITEVSIPDQNYASIYIFPNPNNGHFTLELSQPEQYEYIRILDLSGKQILTITDLQEKNEIELPAACKGYYLLQAVSEKAVVSQKIFVK